MRRSIRFLLALTLVALLAPFLAAQRGTGNSTPPARPIGTIDSGPSIETSPTGKKLKEDAPVVFSAQTQLVLVPVTVTGKDGQPIHGLKKEDFELQEDSKPQPIATFEEVTTSVQRPTRATNPNEFSNVLSGGSDPRRISIILLDALNTPATDQIYARTQLVKYLAKSVDANRLQSLVLLDHKGLRMVHDFTSDSSQLVAALQKVASHPPTMSPQNVSDLQTGAPGYNDPSNATLMQQAAATGSIDAVIAISQFIQQGSDAAAARYQQAAAAEETLEALLHVADVYAGVPGRKSLVWVTGGFPFLLDDPATIPTPDLANLYLTTIKRLADANIAVYTVDARGLVSFASVQTTAGNGGGTTFNPNTSYNARLAGTTIDRQGLYETNLYQTFKEVADVTGGRAFTASNDLVAGFEQIDRDSGTYYMLGFYLDPKDNKAGWRKLKVKVNGQDAKLLYRSGFFVSRVMVNTGTTKQTEVLGALNSPVNATGINLHARWGKITPNGANREVEYFYGAYPGAITADPQQHAIDVDFVGLVFDKEGRQIGDPFGQLFAAPLQPADEAKLAKYGLVTGGSLTLAPGTYFVHFGIRDNKTGRLGTVIAPLTVQ